MMEMVQYLQSQYEVIQLLFSGGRQTLTLRLPVCRLSSVLWSEKELHDAAKKNNTEKLQELIQKGVDVKARNKVRNLSHGYFNSSGGAKVHQLITS